MRIVICDDVIEEAELVKSEVRGILSNESECEIIACDPEALMLEIEEELFDYDIAILDIEFHKEKNGIDFGHEINSRYPLTQIIYLTSILDFASDVYETEHVYFVMKKNRDRTLPRGLKKAMILYEENKEKRYLEIVSEGRKLLLSQHEILYIEREGQILLVHTKEAVYKIYESIRNLLKLLSNSFSRCHGGYIVNMAHVISVNRERILLDQGQELEIGRTFKDRFMKQYMDYLAKRM